MRAGVAVAAPAASENAAPVAILWKLQLARTGRKTAPAVRLAAVLGATSLEVLEKRSEGTETKLVSSFDYCLLCCPFRFAGRAAPLEPKYARVWYSMLLTESRALLLIHFMNNTLTPQKLPSHRPTLAFLDFSSQGVL